MKWREPIILLAVSILTTVIVWLAVGTETAYKNYDGPYYVAIAKTWYDKGDLGKMFSFNLPLEYYPAHFPLYAAAISALATTGINHLQAMLGVNLAASAALSVGFYWIAKKSGWKNPFWMAMAVLFFWPRMWAVRSVGSPETLFMSAIIFSLYFFDTKKYLPAALTGSLAILTKSPGVLLIPTFAVLAVMQIRKTGKIPWEMWPLKLLGLTVVGLFYFYYLQTGDFWAYFHTGDNIHLGFLPFRIFDSSQVWVGSFWLEDIIWVYLLGGLGVFAAIKKNRTWGVFGLIFYLAILFVSHRDISRYSLPIVPVVLMGISELWNRKEIRWATVLILIPMFFYTLNFLTNNVVPIADWTSLL